MSKYFGVEFKREKFDVMGNTIVTFTEKPTGETVPSVPFTIKVTKQGMWFEGYLHTKIVGEKELQDLARLIADAWKDARALAPKILMSESGH